MEGDGKVTPLPPLTDSADFQKIQIPIGELASTLDSLDLRNRNTYRTIEVKDISIFDKTQRGDYLPTNALSQAGDAVISMDGIDVKSGTNLIDDLIPGVTLTLKAPSDSPVDLAVKHDVEGIKKQVMGLVGSYNQIITDIDVLTRRDESIIRKRHVPHRGREKEGKGNTGAVLGDLSLQQLKDSMQNTMMNPYPTSLGRELSLLAQIGISTDTRAPGAPRN